ncbi:MAG: thiamine phosphate synthase [Magnetococcales bacterium]|nr:thiamine phosphate synthase [Magnetococcales bacterium]MBF0155875.1 thiamine phosphate synthase [Magnetococcales bacterium]
MPRILLLTDRSTLPEPGPVIAAALKGGGFHLCLREKGLEAGALLRLASELREILLSGGGTLLVHDRVDVALAIGADGVHLPGGGIPTAAARDLLGPELLLGRSCHHVEEAVLALAAGADYVTLSPIFATRSHPGAPHLGVERFREMRCAIPGPVLALGGIEASNAGLAAEAGADGVALIRGIFAAPDPARVVATLRAIFVPGGSRPVFQRVAKADDRSESSGPA